MYQRALGLHRIGSFTDHAGFDGVFLGRPGMDYHFELTYCRRQPISPTPGPEDLLVFYIADQRSWRTRCQRFLDAGLTETDPINPYWKQRGRTFQDCDGYQLVLQRARWPASHE